VPQSSTRIVTAKIAAMSGGKIFSLLPENQVEIAGCHFYLTKIKLFF
jgi:hypothetical protein